MNKFWKRVRELRRDFPCPTKVVIRTKPTGTVILYGHKMFGYSWYNEDKDTFFIVLDRCDPSIMVDVLWHEWAHCLTWDEWSKKGKHGIQFTRMYNKIYSHYMD